MNVISRWNKSAGRERERERDFTQYDVRVSDDSKVIIMLVHFEVFLFQLLNYYFQWIGWEVIQVYQ